MAKQKAVMPEVSKGRNRAPISTTKKTYCMTSKVVGVSPRLNGFSFKDKDGVDTHCLDWRHLAVFEQSMGYPPVYMGELEEWASTKKGKAALEAMPKEETISEYERRLEAWRTRYPEWFRPLW